MKTHLVELKKKDTKKGKRLDLYYSVKEWSWYTKNVGCRRKNKFTQNWRKYQKIRTEDQYKTKQKSIDLYNSVKEWSWYTNVGWRKNSIKIEENTKWQKIRIKTKKKELFLRKKKVWPLI